jgi:hypothetical protein
MAGRNQAIAAALDELVQAAASLPPEDPTEPPRGTLASAFHLRLDSMKLSTQVPS